jgi:hypothetical protein
MYTVARHVHRGSACTPWLGMYTVARHVQRVSAVIRDMKVRRQHTARHWLTAVARAAIDQRLGTREVYCFPPVAETRSDSI